MRKRTLLAIGASAGAAAYIFSNEEVKQKVRSKLFGFKNRYTGNKDQIPQESSGKPDLQNTENSKMVNEGSQFGVQYYNELREKHGEKEV